MHECNIDTDCKASGKHTPTLQLHATHALCNSRPGHPDVLQEGMCKLARTPSHAHMHQRGGEPHDSRPTGFSLRTLVLTNAATGGWWGKAADLPSEDRLLVLVAGLVRLDVRARPGAQHVQADAALLAAEDLHVPRLPGVRLCTQQMLWYCTDAGEMASMMAQEALLSSSCGTGTPTQGQHVKHPQ